MGNSIYPQWRPKYFSATLGKEYRIRGPGMGPWGRVGKLIKVTPKGFNLLDEKTNQCLLSHHLYCRKWCNKEMPEQIPSKFILTYNGQQFGIEPKDSK